MLHNISVDRQGIGFLIQTIPAPVIGGMFSAARNDCGVRFETFSR